MRFGVSLLGDPGAGQRDKVPVHFGVSLLGDPDA